MRKATADKFRRYTIIAENSVGIGRSDVELQLRTNIDDSSASGTVQSRACVLADGENQIGLIARHKSKKKYFTYD